MRFEKGMTKHPDERPFGWQLGHSSANLRPFRTKRAASNRQAGESIDGPDRAVSNAPNRRIGGLNNA